jgi:membrane-bound lytic murein transglycosylase D
VLMRGPRLLAGLAAAALLLSGLHGCGPARSRGFTNLFLPPGLPAPAAPPAAPEPPDLPPASLRVQLNAAPPLPAPHQLGTPSGWTALLLRQAEWHFQAGRRAYQEGDFDRARREFDRALDILLSPREEADQLDVTALEDKVEELTQAIYKYDLAGLGAGQEGEEAGFQRSPLEEIPPLTFPPDPAMKSRILEEVRATASALPLEVTDEVLSYIRYFSSGRGRQILLNGLRRAGRYGALIERILAEEGLPPELIHVAQAESGFFPRAVSRKRAAGLWQFMKARGNQYGLRQTAFSDERLDPEKATRAAARHLHDLYRQFGDWYLALAAYNAGPVAVERAVERTGYADFWELRRRSVLPKETGNYVPIILAITIMAKNAAEHGLEGVEKDPPVEADSLELTAPTSLTLVADLLDCPAADLRELNPALLKDLAPAGYLLRVPKGSGERLAPVLASIPPERRQGWRAHRVAGGETLPAIAARYRVPQRSIAAANGDLSDGLQPGDLLLIPVKAPAATVKKAAGSSPTAARRPAGTRAPGRAAERGGGPYRTAGLRAVRSSRSAARR